MHADFPSSSVNVKHHWTNAAVLVAGLATIAIAAGLSAFLIGLVDLRI
jgi:hypothetical protein